MEGETPPPAPAKKARGNQPPPAEVEGEAQPPPLPACVFKVLDDDNLLAEIIVRVGFPTSLVRAASVCKRWLRLASDHAFLRRFRKLHPPRLLGFYLARREYPDDESFFPMLPQPPPPEFAAVVHRASFSLGFYEGQTDQHGGLLEWQSRHQIRRNSCVRSQRHPRCAPREVWPSSRHHTSHSAISGDADNSSPNKKAMYCPTFICCWSLSTNGGTTSMVHVYMLQNGDDAWRTHLTLASDYLIYASPNSVLVDDKIYMASAGNEIVVLDLTASSFSTIQLPQGVDFLTTGTTMLSRADDASDVYLINATQLQLHIWLHKEGNWLLVDNICLREMCAPFLEDDPTALLRINHIGDYTAEFLFLEMGRYALYLDVKCRTLRKVHEMRKRDRCFGNIYPFMMIWPPIFPVLKDAPASNAA